jgi:MATE family multidrug resistance protein
MADPASLALQPPVAPAPTPAPTPPRLAQWRTESRALARLALPLIVAQLGWVGMQVTDTIMIGRLGAVPLAGASLGLVLFFTVWVVCTGIAMATAGLAAQAFGARRPRLVRRVIRQGLWVTILLTVPGTAGLLLFTDDVLILMGQPEPAVRASAVYMTALAWALPFSVAFQVLRNFVAALNRPGVATIAMVTGLAVNGLLDYALIFGNIGLPRLEILGAGIATATVNALILLFMAWVVMTRRPFRRYAVLARFHRPDWAQFRRIFRIGLPIAGIYVVESGIFIGSFLLMGAFGTATLAAHLIALQVPHAAFMVPMGISQAATVRVGQAAGRRDPAAAYRAGWTAMAIAVGFMMLTSAVILTLPESLALLFLDPARPDTAAVLASAVGFLFYAALFQAGDGLQVVAAGALRGLNETALPMVIGALGYWGLGGSLAVGLAYGAGIGPDGIWMGFVAALFAVAFLLALRFYQLGRRRYIPEVPPEAAAAQDTYTDR